jgi:molybdopterin molybdotransferase
MLTVEEAQQHILKNISSLDVESVNLDDALGRILADELVSLYPLPPFANSAMDGYAVRSVDLARATIEHPVTLSLRGIVPAGGSWVGEIPSDSTLRIFTGAALPQELDAVVPQERCIVNKDAETVLFTTPVVANQCVRAAGSDLEAGTSLARKGDSIDSAIIGILAASGYACIPVTRQPRVALIVTGDELVEPGIPLEPGKIYNSNRSMLMAQIRMAGAIPIVLPTAHDNVESIRERFLAAQNAELIITSGGASVGDYDFVRTVMEEMGKLDFWQVNIQPGKPLAFGWVGNRPLVGLPGNPVSASVTFEIFVRPVIRRMLGCATITRRIISVPLGEPIQRGSRDHYMRVQFSYNDGCITAHQTGNQDSHRVSSLIGAEALAIIPSGQGYLETGTLVQALLLADS